VEAERWKKLQNDEPLNFHASANIIWGSKIKEVERGGTCTTPEGKRCLEILDIDWE
jgi:hypothetical protein